MSAEPDPTPVSTDVVARLEAALKAAEQRADELAVVARKQSEMADELHAENRKMRDGEVREAVAPLIRGLARLSDELAQMRKGPDPNQGDLAHLAQRVDDLLHDAGVTRIAPVPGDPFDVHVHTAAGSVHTEDPLHDQTVAALRKPGLKREDGRLVRPAEVLVYRFDTRGAAPEPKGPS